MTIIPGNVVISEAERVRLVCCGLRRCGKLETCGSMERDHISCHNDNYSISAISINHIIIRCAISTGAVITISAQAPSQVDPMRKPMEMEMMPVVYNDMLELHVCCRGS